MIVPYQFRIKHLLWLVFAAATFVALVGGHTIMLGIGLFCLSPVLGGWLTTRLADYALAERTPEKESGRPRSVVAFVLYLSVGVALTITLLVVAAALIAPN